MQERLDLILGHMQWMINTNTYNSSINRKLNIIVRRQDMNNWAYYTI